jgi:diaminohydroxyphosphoribosylaminopyrimidine deaminase/5-amino-6-(5-phosphoribosylamino)uracil reductase
MNLALQQAYKNLGNTNENPSVGCVLVKNNCVVSGACTSINGRPHAESIAIKNSRDKLSGTHLYVTLEPCSHYGKTAPCANLIVKKKISKVFYSIKDPDKRSFHKSKIKFKNNKIISGEGLLSNRVKKFYSSYIKSKNNSLPFVTAKIALSKDLYS